MTADNNADNNADMNHRAPRLLAAAATTLLLLLLTPLQAMAAPGAHGPNGEHLDSPKGLRAAASLQRVAAQSEAFELVAELRANELVVMIDRYASNEPVLGARLEVESGALKAVAKFRTEQGDYVVTDAALLKALAAPGEHGLVFTLLAGQDSDLLDGTLVNLSGSGAPTAARHAHGGDGHDGDHPHGWARAAWTGAGVAALGLLSGIAWWRQRRRSTGKLQGGL